MIERLRVRDADGERGVAMILVIIVATLMLAAAVLSAKLTNVSLTGSGRHVRYEGELHLAETGIDEVLARLQQNDTYVTTPTMNGPAIGSTPAQEKAWALAALTSATVQTAPGGSFAVVKPADRKVVYAVGWDKTKTSLRQGRLLKAEYLFSTYKPEGALITGANLQISGSVTVDGSAADVHANGDINFSGSSNHISGDVTASGSITGTSGAAGSTTAGAPQESLPPVDPEEMWALLTPNYASSWYDLCSDGTARQPGGGAPCGGVVLYTGSGATEPFRGWTWDAGTITWKKDAAAEYPGVYFVHHANADLGKNTGSASSPWKATVIVNGTVIPNDCATLDGDLTVSGNPTLVPYVDGMALVAGRDLVVTGNPSITGMMAAHEQVKVSGNVALTGSMLSEDACDTPGSPVNVTTVSGSVTVTYNGNIDVQLGNLIRTALWLEL